MTKIPALASCARHLRALLILFLVFIDGAVADDFRTLLHEIEPPHMCSPVGRLLGDAEKFNKLVSS